MKAAIQETANILDAAEDFRPIVTKGIEILRSYGPELKELMQDVVLASADMKIAVIQKYQDSGFTKQEAIDLCMDQWYQITNAVRNIKPNKST